MKTSRNSPGAAALSFADAQKYFGKRGVVTGNPVRLDFANLAKKARGERLSVKVDCSGGSCMGGLGYIMRGMHRR